MARQITPLALVLVLCGGSAAQELTCAEVGAMAAMARAKSAAELATIKGRSGNNYRSKIVFAVRQFELLPTDRQAATTVLGLIPHSEEEDSAWHTFGSPLCNAGSFEDIVVLAKLGDRLPRTLSHAVLLVPDKMLDYVSYAELSVLWPDSDYAVQMQTVCRKRHQELVKTVEQLQPDKKSWFVTSIFNVGKCRAIALPEAE